jgi:membrane protein
MVFVGGEFAEDLLGFVGLGPDVARAWSIVRWPGALLVAMLVFALIYHVTPDRRRRRFRWRTPGAAVGVTLWLLASWAFSSYLTNYAHLSALYGTFTGAIMLVAWLWLTSCALLLGAELDAEIERHHDLRDGRRSVSAGA